MLKITSLAIIAVLAFSQAANATTIDIVLGSTGSSANTYSTGGTLNPNVDLTNNSVLSMTAGSGVLAAGTSFANIVSSPTGSLYGNEFLFVTGGSSATFSFSSAVNNFGLTWGTIDSYNSLVLTDSRNVTYTITGTEILNQLSGAAGSSQANVIINDSFGNIVKAVLTSTSNSFEAANFSASKSVSAVPLPASSILFALALVGLFFVSRRNQKTL